MFYLTQPQGSVRWSLRRNRKWGGKYRPDRLIQSTISPSRPGEGRSPPRPRNQSSAWNSLFSFVYHKCNTMISLMTTFVIIVNFILSQVCKYHPVHLALLNPATQKVSWVGVIICFLCSDKVWLTFTLTSSLHLVTLLKFQTTVKHKTLCNV